tara:strand:+ start:325 stop:816 length:492 start_codon:yes stop_codon:yes gene_type:complete
MDEVFENNEEPVIAKTKVKKKRQNTEETKKRLREQLKRGRETARLNRLKKKKAKDLKNKPKPKVETVEKEPVSEPITQEEPKQEKPKVEKVKKIAVLKKVEVAPVEEKEVVVNIPSPPKIKEEPMIVETPLPALKQINSMSPPINIPPPLKYQSTFRSMKRKW